ncbi:MAG: T9SS type A sorting domain-containing protein [Bacteroidetes bacterium]|nr:T9SS type A sorting domain-containing protein [Bacteroidota bacterium]
MFNSSSVSFGTSNVFKGCGDDVFYAKLDATTGINEAWHSLNENVVIFPNPSSTGIFTISDELENAEVEVYNVLGAKVYSNASFQNTIDLSAQAKGVYVIQFKLKAQTYSQKIIIE